MKKIFITGGARSGKSSFGERETEAIGKNIVYIATAIAFDDGMKDRIKKHRAQRPKEWRTIEQYKNFDELSLNKKFLEADTILLDCLSLMVSNLLLDYNVDFDKISYDVINKIEADIIAEVEKLLSIIKDKNIIIISNEVGSGLVPSYKLGSVFRDIQGRINQKIANEFQIVYFMVSGLPMKLKG